MRTLQGLLLAPLFVFAVACGGATPTATTPEGGASEASLEKPGGSASSSTSTSTSTSTDAPAPAPAVVQSPECESIGTRMKAVDAARQKDDKLTPAQSAKSLAAALETLSSDLGKEKIATPDLKTAVGELATEARSFAATMKGMAGTLDEMDKVTQSLDVWQKKVGTTANAFDKTCETGPKDECDQLGVELKKIPLLQEQKFAEYATALDAFTKRVDGLKPKDAKVKSSLTAMNAALKEGIVPVRKMSTLMEEPKKIGPASEKLRGKVNQVRVLCGLPPKE
jgi:hypothetical protein